MFEQRHAPKSKTASNTVTGRVRPRDPRRRGRPARSPFERAADLAAEKSR